MFIISGKRKARIKKYTDNHHYCKSCNSFGLNVKVYKNYFHIFFIPLFPIGNKTAKIVCNSCGELYRNDTLQKDYEKNTKTPFYLYTGLILIVSLVVLFVNANTRIQKEKAKFVENPQVGDVYLIRKDISNSTSYYFLRVTRINNDTVLAYHNNLVYGRFVTKLNNDDFFDRSEELVFSKKELKQMLEKGEINSVERNYGNDEGFNRIK